MDDFNGTYNFQPQVPTPPPVQNAPVQPKSSNSLATTSLVVGICSLVFICCCGGFLLGALGIILALLSRGAEEMNSQAKVGLGLSIGSFSLTVLFAIVYLPTMLMLYSGEFQDVFKKEWERQYGYGYEYDYDFYDGFDEDWDEYFQDFPSEHDIPGDA